MVFKPLTTLLFFAIIGRPETTFARWVTAGIALSVVGDIALLGNSNRAFMVGLVAFLLAHVAYVIAFLGVAVWSPHVAIGRGRHASRRRLLLLRAIWKGAAGLHAADDRVRRRDQRDGGLGRRRRSAGRCLMAPYAARRRGAVLRLGREPGAQPLPPARSRTVALLAMGVYWLGQLGIAIAASASF